MHLHTYSSVVIYVRVIQPVIRATPQKKVYICLGNNVSCCKPLDKWETGTDIIGWEGGSVYGGYEKHLYGFDGESWRKYYHFKDLGLEGNIKMGLKEIG